MRVMKRILDVVLSLAVLTVCSPLLLVGAIWIRFDSPGPVFFRQVRVGRDGRNFRIWKFRTMQIGVPEQGPGVEIEAGDTRITRAGKVLRQWSLDEVPQLINVLKGEMSVVGPRPTLRYQVDQYTDRQKKRLRVPPGITGWAQIHGRNVLSWPERIEYDIWYVENWSLWLDLMILWKTPWVLFGKRGLYGRKEDFAIRPNNGNNGS
jgi:lipopolysaccharide/colanic/teichoic acid biosynthesis glycosyltransferase